MSPVPAIFEIQTFLGLPAHPFLLHAPLVLVPLLGLAVTATMLATPERRRRLTVPLAIGGVVGLVLLQLAIGSGQALRQSDDDARTSTVVAAHADLAETLRLVVAAMTGALVVLAVLDREPAATDGANDSLPATTTLGLDRRRFVVGVLRAGAAAAGAAAVVWTLRTGHTGATAVWSDQSSGGSGAAEGTPTGTEPKTVAVDQDGDQQTR